MTKEFELSTPVVYVIFNRPDCVRRSFESIRKAKPKKLFIIADGPRDDHPDEGRLCAECREIVTSIDWDCEVYRRYSDVNLGCGPCIATGISWVFSRVDEAIIIEDDCIPSMSFYRFSQEMLERYKNDRRVLSVSGLGFGYENDSDGDYFFSRFSNSWGWATWKRVWDMYDYEMKDYPQFRKGSFLREQLLRKDYVDYWYSIFDMMYEKRGPSTWDYQFMFLSFLHKGLHVHPKKNMVQCIGWGDTATHCKGAPSEGSELSKLSRAPEDIDFPIHTLHEVTDDYAFDCKLMEFGFGVPIDGKKHLWELSENELNVMLSAEKLIIYGAGSGCRDLICLLGKEGINRFHVAVTKGDGDEYVMGNKVVEIASFVPMKDSSLVVIAVKSEAAIQSMKKELNKLGFTRYIVLGEEKGA